MHENPTEFIHWHLRLELPLAEDFFRLLRAKYPEQTFAFEVRHKSRLEEEPIGLPREYEITFVIADSPRWPKLDITTTETVYLCLHGQEKLYSGPYSDVALERYAFMINDWLLDGKQIWVYFINTMFGNAAQDAKRLMDMVGICEETVGKTTKKLISFWGMHS